jgi:hypothetical protein
MPFIGGRARGRPPPEPPTLTERPGGSPRNMPIPMPAALNDAIPIDGLQLGPEGTLLRHRTGKEAEDDT